jgi:GTP-binding protein
MYTKSYIYHIQKECLIIMVIHEAAFAGSFDRESGCPRPLIPEFAFIGRSNVGKSSLINMLCGRKDIAKVSKTPGKTQLINYFRINNEWNLVDLPGYGFAKISKKKVVAWEKMIEKYLLVRQQLQCAFVLIDIRHPLQSIDGEFIDWMGERQIPFALIYTKADKLNASEVKVHAERINNELLKTWNELPPFFITSSEKSTGRDEVLKYIDGINQATWAEL